MTQETLRELLTDAFYLVSRPRYPTVVQQFVFPKSALDNLLTDPVVLTSHKKPDEYEAFRGLVEEFADYIDIPVITDPEKQDSIIKENLILLAHRAAGGYSVLCTQAAKKYGQNCGVSVAFKTIVAATSFHPNLADPAGLFSGWVSYRAVFFACPERYLARVCQRVE